MRYRFAREGIKTVGSNAFFEPESLKWDSSKPVIVSFTNDFQADNVIGKATDIQREDDGWLTAEIEWNDKGDQVALNLDNNMWLTIYINHILESEGSSLDGNGWRIIKSGDLKAIYATTDTNPWEEEAPKYFCPECTNGKVINCVGQALHPVTDELIPCWSTLGFDEV